MHPYLDKPLPHVLAHQGLALSYPPNSLKAFEAALVAGADFIETDVHATADGVAVIFHDDKLAGQRISAYKLEELPEYIPTLVDAFRTFPEARFNIDIKSSEAIVPTATVINQEQAHQRVLLTSFSSRRRRRTTALATGTAISPSVSEFVPIVLLSLLGAHKKALKRLSLFDAVQIPARGYGLSTTSSRLMKTYSAAGVVVHVWTINDRKHMRQLLNTGVSGIVTDRTDLAVAELKN